MMFKSRLALEYIHSYFHSILRYVSVTYLGMYDLLCITGRDKKSSAQEIAVIVSFKMEGKNDPQ